MEIRVNFSVQGPAFGGKLPGGTRLVGTYTSLDDLSRRLPRDLSSLKKRLNFEGEGHLTFLKKRLIGLGGSTWDPIVDPRTSTPTRSSA